MNVRIGLTVMKKTRCPERLVQPPNKKTPRVVLTKEIPLSTSDKNILLVKQSKHLKQSKQLNKLPTIPETQQQPNQNNHNYCFIESHNKVLDEQQTAHKHQETTRKTYHGQPN